MLATKLFITLVEKPKSSVTNFSFQSGLLKVASKLGVLGGLHDSGSA